MGPRGMNSTSGNITSEHLVLKAFNYRLAANTTCNIFLPEFSLLLGDNFS